MRENAAKILDVYRSTNAAQARGETITPAAQWLLDNNYLVEETIFQIKRDLPRRFYRELPTLTLARRHSRAARAGACLDLCRALRQHGLRRTCFKAIVEGFQSVEPLKIGELWALPSLLRFVLIENLRRIAVRVNRARQMRQIANEVADRVLAAGRRRRPQAILAHYAAHARDTTFATQLLYRLRDGSQNSGKALIWLEKRAREIRLRRRGNHHSASITRCRSGNVTTGNIIRGLRLINDVDWTVWFEDVSRVDALLRERSDLRRARFPLARPVPHGDRGSGAAFRPQRIRGRRAGHRTRRLRVRQPGDRRRAEAWRRRKARMSASSWSARAVQELEQRRSATAPTFGARLNRAFRSDRLARHRRSGVCC